MSFRWCDGEPMDDTGVHIHADVEFDTVMFGVFPSDPYIIPDAAVPSTETSAVYSDVHSLTSQGTNCLIHDVSDVGNGEFVHPTMNH